MFLRSSLRPQPVECFFCLSTSLLPPSASGSQVVDRKGKGRAGESKWNWQCQRCGCWNVRDERGEMVSELPAMRTPTMNHDSFSLRAKPSSSHLPTSSAASPFCHVCQTNQTLIMNMLANYLPDDNDPTYRTMYDDLPAYLSSVHSRYPPVCENCQPAVNDALRKADRRANVDAWGSALRRSHQSEHGSGSRSGLMEMLDVGFWRLRGMLFCASTVLNLGLGVVAGISPEMLDIVQQRTYLGLRSPLALLMFNLFSFLWMAWDPFWLRKRRRTSTEVSGRQAWLIDMAMIYVLRLGVSNWMYGEVNLFSHPQVILGLCCAQVLLLPHAFASLRISAPVATKPIRPVIISSVPSSPLHQTSHQGSTPRPPTDSRHTTHTQSSGVNPMFGQPSFTPSGHPDELAQNLYDEQMDWEPSPRPGNRRPPGLDDDNDGDSRPYESPSKHDWDTFAVGRQRMFPNQGTRDETGLESLIAGWGIDGTSTSSDTGAGIGRRQNPPIAAYKTLFGAPTSTSRPAGGMNDPTPLSQTPASMMLIGSKIIRIVSCLLAIIRCLALSIVLVQQTPFAQSQILKVETIMSSIEIGVIILAFFFPAKSTPSPRTIMLVVELFMRYFYLFGRYHPAISESGFGFGEVMSEKWGLGLTWLQWAMLNGARAML